MSRYVLGLSLGLSFALLVGCGPSSTPPGPNPVPRAGVPADENRGVHVNAPGVNVDAKKTEDEKDKHPEVNVDVKPRQP